MSIVFAFVASFLAGICASMGLGGGSVLILYLTLWVGSSQVEAGGINLLFFIPIAAVSVIGSVKRKAYCLKELAVPVLFGICAAAGSMFLAFSFKPKTVMICFGVLLLVLGLKEGIAAFREVLGRKDSC